MGDYFGGPGEIFDAGGNYFDASDFDDYEEGSAESESESESESGSGTTYDGTNAADTMDKSSETAAWNFNGFSGNDTFIGGSGNDVFWGAVGNDTLTGNAGSDTFYFADNTEGTDTITDFSTSGDTLKFAQPFGSSYTRSSYTTDSGANGSTFNIGLNSGQLPKVFNFTANNSSYSSAAGTKSFLSGLKVTTDGSTSISSTETFVVVTGDGTHSAVYGWTDTGDGVVSNGELFSLAVLSNVDNDTLSSANFAFGTI